jgi:hypothetical protein
MTFVASSTRLKRVIVGIVVATAIAPPIFAQNEQSQGDDQSRGVRIIDAPTPAPTNGPTPDDALTKTQPASSAKAQPATPASNPTLAAPSDEAVSKPTLVPPPDTALSKAPTPILRPAPDATQSKLTPTPNLTPAPDTAQSKAIPVPPPPDTVSKTTPVPPPSTPKPSQAIALPKSTMPPTAKTTAPLPTTAPADSSDFTPHKTAPAPSSPAKLEPASSSPTLAPSSAPSALPAAEPSVSPPAVNDIAALPPRPAGSENPPTAALLEGLSQSIKVANSAELNVEILPGLEIALDSKVSFQITTKKAGYLILFDVDATGKLTQIYPNPMSLMAKSGRGRDNFIRPGKPIHLPESRDALSGFEFVASPPLGTAMIVAFLSDRPVQMMDLPNVPSALLGSASAAELLSKFADDLRISDPSGKDTLQEAHWSMDVKFYAIR